jgi:hypothetical protein
MSSEDEIPCVFQIPLTYGHNHEPVEPEKILLIQQAIVRQFHGFTPLGLIRDGMWVDESEGRIVSEDQMRVEVWVPRSRIPDFKLLVRKIGHETRQKQMFVIIPKARVHRLDIQDTDAGNLVL